MPWEQGSPDQTPLQPDHRTFHVTDDLLPAHDEATPPKFHHAHSHTSREIRTVSAASTRSSRHAEMVQSILYGVTRFC